MMPSAVPVAVHGFTWTAALVGILNLLVGGALVAWVKSRPRMRELEIAEDAALVKTLTERVAQLEKRLDEETGKREIERAKHEATLSLMRHRLNNSDQCIDSLLLLLETAPEKAGQAVTLIKDMRARQREAEALEKAAIQAATVTAATNAMTEKHS